MDSTLRKHKIERIRQGASPRVLDLFAGCGGLSLGFHSAGFEVVGALDIDEMAMKSHSSPDIVLPRYSAVINVHGCFWHMHDCKYGAVKPKQNAEFWEKKRNASVTRDKKNELALMALGWRVLVIWECELRDMPRLEMRLTAFLNQ